MTQNIMIWCFDKLILYFTCNDFNCSAALCLAMCCTTLAWSQLLSQKQCINKRMLFVCRFATTVTTEFRETLSTMTLSCSHLDLWWSCRVDTQYVLFLLSFHHIYILSDHIQIITCSFSCRQNDGTFLMALLDFFWVFLWD